MRPNLKNADWFPQVWKGCKNYNEYTKKQSFLWWQGRKGYLNLKFSFFFLFLRFISYSLFFVTCKVFKSCKCLIHLLRFSHRFLKIIRKETLWCDFSSWVINILNGKINRVHTLQENTKNPSQFQFKETCILKCHKIFIISLCQKP